MKYHFNQNQKEPEPVTTLKNKQAYAKEELLSKELQSVLRGHCYESCCYIGKEGEVWNPDAYAFLNYSKEKIHQGTISKELQQRAKNYRINGIFEVVPDRIFQVRGYDTTNLTLVRTTDKKNNQYGWVVINCLHSKECTYEALKLADAYFKQKNQGMDKESYWLVGNIKAVIITEADEAYYGGVRAILYFNQGCCSLAEEELYEIKEDVTILTGETFMETCMKDTIYWGSVKRRRESLAYGTLLKPSEKGRISAGFGQGVSYGTRGFQKPVSVINRSCEYLVRGLRIQFQISSAVPGCFHMYFPDYQALWMSHWEELFYQINGFSKPEWDGLWKYYMEAYELFREAKVLFQANSRPFWQEGDPDGGETDLQCYIKAYAALYKFWRDETLCYASMGDTIEEIAKKLEVPEEFQEKYPNRITKEEAILYVKAVYERQFGWYDGNPIHFASLDRKEKASTYMKYFREDSLDIAVKEYEEGHYQAVAEVLELALLAEPSNEKVRYLLADSLEQLGYQASYGAMRNAYLGSAYELRNPQAAGKLAVEMENEELFYYLTPEKFLEALSISYHCREKKLNFIFDIKFMLEDTVYYRVFVKNGCLLYCREEKEMVLNVFELDRGQMYRIYNSLGRGRRMEEVVPPTENRELNQNLIKLFSCMVNLSEYKGFAVIEENIRGIVISCKNMLISYYEKMKKAEKEEKYSFREEDLKEWQEVYYPKLVEAKYTGFQNISGIRKEGTFQKYEYFLVLYQCFRYLARYCKDTEENRHVLKCIQIMEPYLERFEGEHPCSERTIYFNVFDFHAIMDEWQMLMNVGIGLRSDGKITGCELLQFLLEAYWFLYDNGE